MYFESLSPDDTEHLGYFLGSISKKGYLICLVGDLGVGKTEFVKGFAKGLGVEEYVTSPTFIIVNEYKGRLPLYHFDVYRINNTDEMYEIGYEEYFYGDGVCIIEWGDMIESLLPQERITVTISKDITQGVDYRNIDIIPSGDKYNSIIPEMLEKCDF